MKKQRTLLLALLLLCLLTVPAWAVATEDSGMYTVVGLTQLRTAAGDAVSSQTVDTYGTYYADAERFSVTCEGVTAGKSYTVFVVKGGGKPTADNIYYVDQKTAEGDSVTFDAFPSVMADGDYRVYVSGPGKALDTAAPLATFSYHYVPKWDVAVRLGDADSEATVTLTRNGSPLTGSDNVYSRLVGDSYELTVTKGDLVAYKKTIDLTADVTLDIPTLVEKGNVNGAPNRLGKNVSVEDMACLFTFLSTSARTGQIQDAVYFDLVCDVNEDDVVNILDYQALYEMLTTPQA